MRIYSLLILIGLAYSNGSVAEPKKVKKQEKTRTSVVEFASETRHLPVVAGSHLSKTCDEALLPTATPLDTARVIDLSQDFVIHKNTLANNGKPFIFQERRLSVNGPGAMFKVSEQATGHFSLLTSEGKKYFDHRYLEAAVNTFLSKNKKGKLEYIHYDSAVLSPNGSSIIFSFHTENNIDYVASYNVSEVGEGDMHIFFEKADRHHPNVHIEHERFVLIEAREDIFIYDLKTGQSLRITNDLVPSHEPENKRFRARARGLSISEDGKTLLMTVDLVPNDRSHWYKNYRITLPSNWKTLQTQNFLASKLGKTKKFDGFILAKDSSLNRFIVDSTHQEATYPNKPGMHAPYVLPELEMLDVNDSKIQGKSLNGWSGLSTKIKEAAQKGAILTVDATKGSITKDGKHFMLDLSFRTEIDLPVNGNPNHVKRFSFDQNLVNLWDIESDEPPTTFASSGMDTEGDMEPNPKILGEHTGRIWRRQYASRLLEDGTVIMARIMVQEKNENSSDVIFKVASINAQGLVDIREYNGGPVNLDPHDASGGWTGVFGLQISPDGKKVIYSVTGVGLKLIDISR